MVKNSITMSLTSRLRYRLYRHEGAIDVDVMDGTAVMCCLRTRRKRKGGQTLECNLEYQMYHEVNSL